jgi:hypothetical protein
LDIDFLKEFVMKKIFKQAVGLFVIMCCILVSPAFSQSQLDIEGGGVFPGYNDVRVPNATGTQFSLTEDLTADAQLYYRIRFSLALGRRHWLSILYAPLTIKANGQIGNDVFFEDQTFAANTPLEGLYKFNSYRLTYRYDLIRRPRLVLGVGITAKIRDAEVKLSGGGLESNSTDFGFVPLLHFRLLWRFTRKLGILVEGDAAAAKQGRAEDVMAALIIPVSQKWTLKAGYRILEGGADVDQVYNFALLNYVVVGAILGL